VEEQFGGPVWHASGSVRKGTRSGGRRIARGGLGGAGDRELGEWAFDGEHPAVVHIVRRLSDAEREEFSVPEPYDIRNTVEELRRLAVVHSENPLVQILLP